MIVDLNLQNKTVVVAGGGNEAQKRINSLLNQECKIIVISNDVIPQITKLSKSKKIILKKQKITDVKFISKLKPDIIITTTNDKKINQKIISSAKKAKIIAYSSDNPDESDFSNPAIIDFEKIVQIAIFTGGKSPAMSKKLKTKSEKIFKKIITYSSDNPDESDFSNPAIIEFEKMIQIAIFTGSPAMSKKLKKKSEEMFKKIITKQDIAQIKIQKIARDAAKEKIPTPAERKACLRSIMADNDIDQLIKDGQMKKAEKRAITIVRSWK